MMSGICDNAYKDLFPMHTNLLGNKLIISDFEHIFAGEFVENTFQGLTDDFLPHCDLCDLSIVAIQPPSSAKETSLEDLF